MLKKEIILEIDKKYKSRHTAFLLICFVFYFMFFFVLPILPFFVLVYFNMKVASLFSKSLRELKTSQYYYFSIIFHNLLAITLMTIVLLFIYINNF